MRHIPLVVANMDPELYQQAKDHLLDWSYADYFYIISYPSYGGYRIDHDSTYTAYLTTAVIPYSSNLLAGLFGLITIVALVMAVGIIMIVIFLLTRRSKKSYSYSQITNH